VACPFFEPRERLRDVATRMPLGDVWSGVCRAGDAPFTPSDSTVTELCNMGYARDACVRFPGEDAPDAVRFLIARDRDQLIRIAYAVERDHHPRACGTLDYLRLQGALDGARVDALLESQALAYVASYLRRRPAAAA
jgi:hypothetical protein